VKPFYLTYCLIENQNPIIETHQDCRECEGLEDELEISQSLFFENEKKYFL
jgi:hypothetical protein